MTGYANTTNILLMQVLNTFNKNELIALENIMSTISCGSVALRKAIHHGIKLGYIRFKSKNRIEILNKIYKIFDCRYSDKCYLGSCCTYIHSGDEKLARIQLGQCDTRNHNTYPSVSYHSDEEGYIPIDEPKFDDLGKEKNKKVKDLEEDIIYLERKIKNKDKDIKRLKRSRDSYKDDRDYYCKKYKTTKAKYYSEDSEYTKNLMKYIMFSPLDV